MRMQKLLILILAVMVCVTSAQSGRRYPTRADFPPNAKFIALTYDDGPNITYTPQILSNLNQYGAKATFYVNPAKFNASTLPVIREMIATGHDVDNHTWTHQSMGGAQNYMGPPITNTADARADLRRASQAIFDATGYWPFSFRAPFFEWGSFLVGLDEELMLPFVDSRHDTNDFSFRNTARMVADFIMTVPRESWDPGGAVDGAIILMHDCGGGSRQHVADAIHLYVPQMQAQGWVFVTVRELFMIKQANPERFNTQVRGFIPRVNPAVGFQRPGWQLPDMRYLWEDAGDWWLQRCWWTNSTPPWQRWNGTGYGNCNATSIDKTPSVNRKSSKFAFAGISNGQINLQLQAGVYTVELYNLQGRLVGRTDINAVSGVNATGLKTDNLSSGIFILNVKQAGNSVLRHRIMMR